ncbi:PLP-dependent aminotransferase family protein [Isoalcanivorax beigongshangi]|uniref:PLP-dependent aminotransferase family protein n=1 Tax=Isoalcanivorax beigongshangi TaxID=3238810 RepID=A0ABV4AFW3_9GAMM
MAESKPEQIAQHIRQQITAGILTHGEKLPSIRSYAKLYGYSKNTVITAYDILTASGHVEPQHGRGFFVTDVSPRRNGDEIGSINRAMDTIWLMRQQLIKDPKHQHPGDGFPPKDWLMDMRLDKFHRQVVRTGVTTLFRYGERYGYAALREQLVRRLAGLGVYSMLKQIVTTHGANEALDLVIRHQVIPGEPVLVDEPGYYPLFGKLRLHGAEVIGIPREADGPDIAALEQALRTRRARFFFTQSAGHNPTGTDLSLEKAERILQLARQHDVLIIENDALADFKHSSAVKLSALDQLRRTLYIGSFSKSISASLRIGFIACDPPLADGLADLKMLLHVSNSEYSERAVEVILREGNFLRHTQRLQSQARAATAAAVAILKQLGAELFVVPNESLYLWARFPQMPDSLRLARELLSYDMMLAPGAFFYLDARHKTPWCRYNVAEVAQPSFASTLRAYLAALDQNS